VKDGTYVTISKCNCGMSLLRQSGYFSFSKTRHVLAIKALESIGPAALGGITFGAIHCLAWNFTVPTAIEQELWHVASVLLIAGPLGLFICSIFNSLSLESIRSAMRRYEDSNDINDVFNILLFFSQLVSYLICRLLIVLYTIARLFIMVEIIRSLFYLPVDAYAATWAASIPRFG
jgi:hypothetical protein